MDRHPVAAGCIGRSLETAASIIDLVNLSVVPHTIAQTSRTIAMFSDDLQQFAKPIVGLNQGLRRND